MILVKKEELFAKFGRRFYHSYVTEIADVIDFFEILPKHDCLKRTRISATVDMRDFPEIKEELCNLEDVPEFIEDALISLSSESDEAKSARELLRFAIKDLDAQSGESVNWFFARRTLGGEATSNQFKKVFELD